MTEIPEAHDNDGVDDEFFRRYQQAWSDCDAETIAAMMTPDGLYEASYGSQPWGERYEGREAIRTHLQNTWADPANRSRHVYGDRYLLGNRGFAEWTSTPPDADDPGETVHGADFYEFRDGLVAKKIAYRKAVDR